MQRATSQTARRNGCEGLIEGAVRPTVAQHCVSVNRQHVKVAISPEGEVSGFSEATVQLGIEGDEDLRWCPLTRESQNVAERWQDGTRYRLDCIEAASAVKSDPDGGAHGDVHELSQGSGLHIDAKHASAGARAHVDKPVGERH